MVRLMGLNRDPDNFPNIYKKNSEKVIMRRVYYKLISLDVHNSFDYGCPLIISDNEYDVKLPTLPDDQIKILHDFKKGLSVEKSGDEIRKLVFENSINKDIALEYDAIVLLREGLNAFQNFKLSVKTSSLHKVTDKIQNFLDNKIPSIWEYLQDNYANNQLEKLFDVPRVKKIEIRITVQTMLMAFYYLIYINEMNSPQIVKHHHLVRTLTEAMKIYILMVMKMVIMIMSIMLVKVQTIKIQKVNIIKNILLEHLKQHFHYLNLIMIILNIQHSLLHWMEIINNIKHLNFSLLNVILSF